MNKNTDRKNQNFFLLFEDENEKSFKRSLPKNLQIMIREAVNKNGIPSCRYDGGGQPIIS